MEKVIQQRKAEFWGQDCFHDISFILADNVEMKANRMILALCSPVFEKMFYGKLAEKRNPIPIVDIESDVFEVFLKYIYTGEFETNNLEEAKYLFYIAHKYEITTMEATCEQYMIKNIKTFDLTELIPFAEMFSMQNLVELCRLHMQHHPRTDLPVKWVSYKKGDPIPEGINFFDTEKDGWPIGVGCVRHQEDILPGILYIKDMKVKVAYGAKSHEYDNEFEVLCDGNLEWKPSELGNYVEKSIPGGKAFYNEILYIGKTNLEGNVYIGKVHPSHSGLYIPYQSAEFKVEKYLQLIDVNQPKEESSHMLQYLVHEEP